MDDDYSFEVPQVNFQQIDEEVDQQQLNQFFDVSNQQNNDEFDVSDLSSAQSNFMETSNNDETLINVAEEQLNINNDVPQSNKKHLTHEERERLSIERAKKESERLKMESKKSYKLLELEPPAKKYFKVKVTNVKEFKFATDKRVHKNHEMQTRNDKYIEKNEFKRQLRSSTTPNQANLKLTQPKPFSFVGKQRKRPATEDAEYVSTAEMVNKFANKTPSRFHKAAKNSNFVKGSSSRRLGNTVPKTPNFSKRTKTVTHNIPSFQDKLEQEFEEAKKNQFKARPVNKQILSKADTLKKVNKKKVTVPLKFNFASDNLPAKAKKEDGGASYVFKAQQIPQGMLKGVTGVKEKKKAASTKPVSPNFSKHKKRQRVEPATRTVEQPRFYKPPPKTTTGVMQLKSNTSRSVTQPKPFAFDARDKERFAKKEQKLQEEREKSLKLASTFRARKAPNMDSPSRLPPKSSFALTKIEPFNLEIEERVGTRVEEHKRKILEKEKLEAEKRNFKANTGYEKVLKKEAWKPELKHKFTEVLDVDLKSTVRAQKRNEYDQQRKILQDQSEAIAQAEIEAAKCREIEEAKELRKQMNVKAHDIRKYKPIRVAKSEKSLTKPMSPNFSTRFNK